MKKFRLAAIILCIIIPLSVLSGCKKVFETAADVPLFPVLINGIVIDKRPARVACLSASVYEIAADFGYESQIAFLAEDIKRNPSETSAKTEESETIKIGTAAAPNIDGLIAAAPDLIITTERLNKRDLDRLSAAERKVIILSPAKNLAELDEYYKNIGTAFGGTLSPVYSDIVIKDGTVVNDGSSVAEGFYKNIATLIESHSAERKTSFVYVLSVSPPIAATNDTFAGNIISYFGENLGEGSTTGVETGFVGSLPSKVFAALPLGGANLAPLDLGVVPDDVISLDNSAFMLQSPSKLTDVINTIIERMGE